MRMTYLMHTSASKICVLTSNHCYLTVKKKVSGYIQTGRVDVIMMA